MLPPGDWQGAPAVPPHMRPDWGELWSSVIGSVQRALHREAARAPAPGMHTRQGWRPAGLVHGGKVGHAQALRCARSAPVKRGDFVAAIMLFIVQPARVAAAPPVLHSGS